MCFKTKTLITFDSLNLVETGVIVMDKIWAFVNKEHCRVYQKNIGEKNEWRFHIASGVPQQNNTYDCGIYACYFTKTLLLFCTSDAFKMENMIYENSSFRQFLNCIRPEFINLLRKQIKIEIALGKLLETE